MCVQGLRERVVQKRRNMGPIIHLVHIAGGACTCVCVCVCVRESSSESESACECVCVCVSV